MKLTDPRSIQEAENALIDTLGNAVDWQVIRQLLLENHLIPLENQVAVTTCTQVVCSGQIVYKLDFEIRMPLSVAVSRQGDCLDIGAFREDRSSMTDPFQKTEDLRERAGERQERLAAGIAAMIHEINQ